MKHFIITLLSVFICTFANAQNSFEKLSTAPRFNQHNPHTLRQNVAQRIDPQGYAQYYIMDAYVETARGTEMMNGIVTKVSKEGNNAFIYNLFPAYYERLWVHATIDGDKAVIDHNEVVGLYTEYDEMGTEYRYELRVGEPIFNEYEEIVDMLDVTLTTDGSSFVMTDDINSPEHPIALYSGDDEEPFILFDWTFCNDLRPYYASTTITELPADAKKTAYRYDYKDYTGKEAAGIAHVAVSGNDYYFDGLTDVDSRPWVKGTREGNTITITPGALLEMDTQYFYFSGLNSATMRMQDLVFTIDDATGKITHGNESDSFAVVYTTNSTHTQRPLISYSFAYNLTPCTDSDKTIKPSAPENVGSDYYSEFGQHAIYFYQYATAEDGTNLNPDDLGYYIYVDGERYTFDRTLYPYIGSQSMTFMPYHYCDDYQNGDIFCDGYLTIIMFRIDDYTTLGVQSAYRTGDIETRSDIVTVDKLNNVTIVPDSANGIAAPTLDKTATSWYDLSGRHTDKLRGIVIADGMKVMK